MKQFIFALLTLAMCAPAFATSGTPGYPLPADAKSRLSRQTFQSVDLGVQLVSKKVQLMKALYSFAVQGGASTLGTNALKLKDVDGKDAVLPNKAVIKQVLIDVITVPTASAVAGFTAPKFSLDYNVPQDLLASTLATSFSGRMAGIPVGTAATMVKATGQSALTVTLSGGSVTAGKFNVFVEYYLSD